MKHVNEPAVPFALPDPSGRIHHLSDYAGSWLLLVFHRHLGWLPCRGHLSQLRERNSDLQVNNLKVVVISFEAGFLARQYIAETGLEWPLLVDESRNLYRAYDMLAAGFRDIWGPSTWVAYFKEILRGRLPRKSSGDIRQRGGDVLIDPEGIVRLHHVGIGPADRPEVDAILRTISSFSKSVP